MPNYYIEVGNSCEDPLALAADVRADSEEEAIAKLRAFVTEQVGISLDPGIVMLELETRDVDIAGLTVYLNTNWLTAKQHVTGHDEE